MCITETHTHEGFELSDFELPGGLNSASFVKVKDVSVRKDFEGLVSTQAATLNGFDLNALLALHDNETFNVYSETAWGEGTLFVERGNCATYFEYTIECCKDLVDTVRVPSDGKIVYSKVLLDGQEYILEASGTFTYNNADDWADAEYYLKNGIVVKGDTGGSQTYVLDVSVNGNPVNDDWGVYDEDHIYDSAYGDNNGSITVEIYKVW